MDQVGGKWPIWGTLIAIISALMATVLTMFKVDPFKATAPEKILFFLSVFVGVWGLATLVIFFVRRFWSKHLPSLQIFNTSLWYGLLLAVILVGSLIFKKI